MTQEEQKQVHMYTSVQILALTLLHIHTLPGGPLPAALCRCSAHALTRGWSYPTPLAHSHTQTHTLSYRIAMGVYSLSLSPSLSMTRC